MPHLTSFEALHKIEEICQSVLVADRLRITYQLGEIMQPKNVNKPAAPFVRQSSFRASARTFNPKTFNASLSGNDATFDISGVSTVSISISPLDARGNPSQATLTLDNFVSDDLTVLTISPDPSNTNGAIITFVGDGTASITATATATEPDGVTTEQIQGVGNITLTSNAAGVATSLAFTYGVPQ